MSLKEIIARYEAMKLRIDRSEVFTPGEVEEYALLQAVVYTYDDLCCYMDTMQKLDKTIKKN